MAEKGPDAFRTISETAEAVGAPAHALRFWESKFSFLRPMRRPGGRRFYRPNDVAVLVAVRRLLHDHGYAIKDLQKLGAKGVLEAAANLSAPEAPARPRLDSGPRIANLQGLRSALERAERARLRLEGLLSLSRN